MIPNIDKLSACRILVVGDLMIDEYLWGKVERISPEAPVQVVTVANENYTLGGAGNVVNNLIALGAAVSVAGVIGTGTDGGLLVRRFSDLGVDTQGAHSGARTAHHAQNPNHCRQPARAAHRP